MGVSIDHLPFSSQDALVIIPQLDCDIESEISFIAVIVGCSF